MGEREVVLSGLTRREREREYLLIRRRQRGSSHLVTKQSHARGERERKRIFDVSPCC